MSKTTGVCEKCHIEALHRLDRDEGYICENCDRELENIYRGINETTEGNNQ